MPEKVIPHTQNAITVSLTNKKGTNESLAMSQKGVTECSIEDAPMDGKIYGRKDGQWVEISTTQESTTPETSTNGGKNN